MALVTEQDLNSILKAEVRLALFSDDEALEAVLLAKAESAVAAALVNSGYPVPASAADTPELVKLAVLEEFVLKAYGRNGLPVPPGLVTEYQDGNGQTIVGTKSAIISGAAPIPDLVPTARDAVGGVTFSDTSSSSTSSRAPVFSSAWARTSRHGP